ncbi:hypothetical protein MA5S0921_4725 [Mycobacteroides abscessus 5S-0921]|nr:hypothetical protein MA5S0304_3768 [Mycobacteroides abscessus 5S-0304]EIU21660.1 hypothetical protein MA5S0708_3694 [Mycobacteroides abscessus 5S-0708]EIU31159.1 hypothetical protein MA5S1212_3449 [Mycobacteroides abscessus 5S-1212]EIU87122.1 hypothetical protein MA5S0921_4725 [Mycobacteroides abscessus 5S-0921]EIV65480.1 hypothetical protein MMCCUG48898_4397 [Mycobacteroides abscessus subsp. massiliense CCUG 48898 = JCM 15300]
MSTYRAVYRDFLAISRHSAHHSEVTLGHDPYAPCGSLADTG